MADARIEAAAAALSAAPHGNKGQIVEELAEQLGCSVPTAHRHLRPVLAHISRRKPRADRGAHALSYEDAEKISALIEETRRLTGTGALPVGQALAILRSNGEIAAKRIDKRTGELIALSDSAILRALKHYGCHPEQLAEATPAVRMSSPHPNWCWQIDASVSRQFYLADTGAEVMAKREFYRGKPKNFQSIASRRIWRYVITDHCSGCIEVVYVQGAESTSNLITALIHAMTRRPNGTMHGVPNILMTDPGSAMTSAATAAFCTALDMRLIINEVGNARAKGQVENAQYIVERNFEAALKLQAPVTSIDEINTLAQVWAYGYNTTRIHTRTQRTRRDAWLAITREQLRLAPSVKVLKQLPTSEPKPCKVRDAMIRYKGGTYDVRGIPGLLNGQRVNVVINALDPGASVRVLIDGAEGEAQKHYIAPRIGVDANGFSELAHEIGSAHGAIADTPADTARKALERLAMDVQTDEEAAAARKAKKLPFNGRIDPMKHLRDVNVPPAIPRAGVISTVQAPEVLADRRIEPVPPRQEFAPVDHGTAALRIKRLLERAGHAWQPSMFAAIAQRWPDGVPYDQVDALAVELAPSVRSGLRVIDGGAP